jgi:hypothetical protein
MNPDDENDALAPARGLLIGCVVILAFWSVLCGLLGFR